MDIRNTIKDILSSTVKTDIVGVGAGKELLTLIGDKSKLPYVGSIIDNIKKLHDRPAGVTINQIYSQYANDDGELTGEVSVIRGLIEASSANMFILIYYKDDNDGYFSSLYDKTTLLSVFADTTDDIEFSIGTHNMKQVYNDVIIGTAGSGTNELIIQEVK